MLMSRILDPTAMSGFWITPVGSWYFARRPNHEYTREPASGVHASPGHDVRTGRARSGVVFSAAITTSTSFRIKARWRPVGSNTGQQSFWPARGADRWRIE